MYFLQTKIHLKKKEYMKGTLLSNLDDLKYVFYLKTYFTINDNIFLVL